MIEFLISHLYNGGTKSSYSKVTLWDFNNNKNAIETAKKIWSLYGQGIISEL